MSWPGPFGTPLGPGPPSWCLSSRPTLYLHSLQKPLTHIIISAAEGAQEILALCQRTYLGCRASHTPNCVAILRTDHDWAAPPSLAVPRPDSGSTAKGRCLRLPQSSPHKRTGERASRSGRDESPSSIKLSACRSSNDSICARPPARSVGQPLSDSKGQRCIESARATFDRALRPPVLSTHPPHPQPQPQRLAESPGSVPSSVHPPTHRRPLHPSPSHPPPSLLACLRIPIEDGGNLPHSERSLLQLNCNQA